MSFSFYIYCLLLHSFLLLNWLFNGTWSKGVQWHLAVGTMPPKTTLQRPRIIPLAAEHHAMAIDIYHHDSNLHHTTIRRLSLSILWCSSWICVEMGAGRLRTGGDGLAAEKIARWKKKEKKTMTFGRWRFTRREKQEIFYLILLKLRLSYMILKFFNFSIW